MVRARETRSRGSWKTVGWIHACFAPRQKKPRLRLHAVRTQLVPARSYNGNLDLVLEALGAAPLHAMRLKQEWASLMTEQVSEEVSEDALERFAASETVRRSVWGQAPPEFCQWCRDRGVDGRARPPRVSFF